MCVNTLCCLAPAASIAPPASLAPPITFHFLCWWLFWWISHHAKQLFLFLCVHALQILQHVEQELAEGV